MHLIFAIHGYIRLGANSETKGSITDVTFSHCCGYAYADLKPRGAAETWENVR